MKVIFAVVIITICTLTACTIIPNPPPEEYINLGTPSEALSYVATHIRYVDDTVNDWQLPTRTYRLQGGDCEDIALLLMSGMRRAGETDVYLVALIRPNDEKHAVVWWQGVLYEAQTGSFYSGGGRVIAIRSFEDCLEWCR